jgi:hypothetical protein
MTCDVIGHFIIFFQCGFGALIVLGFIWGLAAIINRYVR